MKLSRLNKILSILLCFLLLIHCMPHSSLTSFAADDNIWDGTTVDTSWYNTADTSFTIDTAAELAGLAAIVNGGTDNFSGDTITLTTNINLDEKLWTPVGKSNSVCFKGIFDGGGHTISNLKIESDQRYVGLFGYVNGAALKNVVLDSPDVTTSYSSANASVGSLVGYHSGTGNIEFCGVRNGSVSAPNSTCASSYSGLGGLVGCHNASGNVNSCYSYMTDISTKNNTMTRCGGVAGSVDEMAMSCYTYNTKQKGTSVVGNYVSGSGTPAKYSAYLKADGTDSSSISWSSYSVALSEEEFKNGTAAYYLRIGAYSEFNTVSYLWGQDIEGDNTEPMPVWNGTKVYRMQYVQNVEGTGTVITDYVNELETKQINGETYHVIYDVYDWVLFANFVNSNNGNVYSNRDWNAIVEPAGATIDFSKLGTLAYHNGSWQKVVNIGAGSNANAYYSGTFNGNGCTIKGLKYESAYNYGAYTLFGYTDTAANISNITVENAGLTATNNHYLATFVRENRGTLENCHAVNVKVSSPKSFCGGIAYTNYGTIKKCSFSGSVVSGGNAGGIAASANSGAQFLKCWNTGSVSGKTTSASYGNYAGGILAQETNGVTIDNCYNTGNITGYYAGGIMGSRYGYGTVKNCHSYGSVLTGTKTYPVAYGSGVTNCYYLADSETDNVNGTTYKNADAFKDGTVLDLLNGGNAETVWYEYVNYPILEKKELPHLHGWSFSVSDTNNDNINDTIAATCTTNGCEFDKGNGGSVTLVAPADLVCDNSSKDATLSYSADWALGEVTITYNDTDRVNVTGNDITASISLGEGDNKKEVSVTYKIIAITVSFDANGGTLIDPITVIHGQKYGKLPSSAVTGLSGGDSNWYLVDENGAVTETKITRSSNVEIKRDHKLFVKRKVLTPTLKITLEVPGAISDGYQYYVPGNSQRILTVTVNNQNANILDYTYQWYKDGTAIEGATDAVLTLDGNVADNGTYKVKVTATMKDGTGIVVTSDTASAEKEQKVKIMRATNTLYYEANGGEEGPSSNYTGGTTATVSKSVPIRKGYVFDGWNTKADGTGEKYNGGETYTFADDNGNGNGGCDVTLYAQWVKAYGVFVGGVQVIETNKNDVFGDGKVSYDSETNTLTLNNYSYEGDGYQYGSDEDEETGEKEFYSAAIYSENSINIKLVGNNTVKNTFADLDKGQYGDAVVIEGSVIFTGEGSLDLYGDYGIETNDYVIVDGCALYLDADDGIIANNLTIKNAAYVWIVSERDGIANYGELIIEKANLSITAGRDGVYAVSDITITDSMVSVEAERDGFYSYNGKMLIESTETKISDYGPWLDGTKVTVKAGGEYGVFAYNGLTIDDKLTISTPEGGSVGELSENGYTYSTVVQEGAAAKEIVIEPLGYKVYIRGLAYNMVALVPANKSVNEVHCERFDVTDFSEILDTEKDGYIFGGWYTDEACTDGNEFDFDTPVTSEVTIYAKWIRVYTINIEKSDGGDVVASQETATKGETVVITTKPADGKVVDTVIVTDESGTPVTVNKKDDGTYSFMHPESAVTVKVTYKDNLPTVETSTTPNALPTTEVTPTPDVSHIPEVTPTSDVSLTPEVTPTPDEPESPHDSQSPKSPETGDNNIIWLWFVMMFVSGGVLFRSTFVEREKRIITKK